jgi:hypothetical protein
MTHITQTKMERARNAALIRIADLLFLIADELRALGRKLDELHTDNKGDIDDIPF